MLALITTFSCISSFLFGYDLGLMGGALLHIKETMHTSDGINEVIVGAAKLGAVLGTFFGGALMLRYGRRKAIAVDSIFFLIGPLIMALSWNVTGLILGRVTIGIGIGVSAVVVPAYLGEVAPAKVRGRVVELYEVMLCFGMLSAALVDAALDSVPGNWRWMVGAPVIPAIVMALAVAILPESPRWLVTEGRLDEALAVIHQVHTSQVLPSGMQGSTAEVEDELLQLWSSVEKDKAATFARLNELRRRRRSSHRGGGGGGGDGGGNNNSYNNHYQQEQDTYGYNSNTNRYTYNETTISLGQEGCNETSTFARATTNPSPVPSTCSSVEASDVIGIPPKLKRIRTRSTDRLYEMDTSGGSDSPWGAAAAAAAASATVVVPLDDNQALPPPSPLATAASGQLLGEGVNLSRANSSSASGRPPLPPAVPLHQTQHQTQPLYINNSTAAAAAAGQDGSRPPSQQLLDRASTHNTTPPSFFTVLWHVIRDVALVARGPERYAFRMIVVLAFFNQAFASTAIINYAPSVLITAGVESRAAAELFTSLVGASKLIGVGIAFLLVDSLGRRPLLLWGSVGCAASLALLVPADAFGIRWLLVTGMCIFVLAFSLSWAGVFWVLLSEVFSMYSKSSAASAATAVLFLTGAIADLLFLTIHNALGAFAFMLFALIALAAAIYVAVAVPETKGRTLQEVQNLLQGRKTAAASGGGGEGQFDTQRLMEIGGGSGLNIETSTAGMGLELPNRGIGRDW